MEIEETETEQKRNFSHRLSGSDVKTSSASLASFQSVRNDASIVKRNSKAPFCGFGIFCGVMAGMVFALNTFLAKYIQSTEAFQLSASRCIVQALVLIPFSSYQWLKNSVDIIGSPDMFKLLVLRGVFGSTGLILLYQSIQRISVGDSVTLLFTSTLFAAILGCLFLNERLSIVEGVMIMLTLVGVALISKPTIIFGGGDHQSTGELLAGLAFGLGSGFLNGCTMVILRKLGKQNVHPSLNILYYSVVGSLTSSIMVIITNSFRFPCWQDLPYISLLGITGIAGQVLMTVGLQYERAAVFPAIRSLQIVFVYILQVSFTYDCGGFKTCFFSFLTNCRLFLL